MKFINKSKAIKQGGRNSRALIKISFFSSQNVWRHFCPELRRTNCVFILFFQVFLSNNWTNTCCSHFLARGNDLLDSNLDQTETPDPLNEQATYRFLNRSFFASWICQGINCQKTDWQDLGISVKWHFHIRSDKDDIAFRIAFASVWSERKWSSSSRLGHCSVLWLIHQILSRV